MSGLRLSLGSWLVLLAGVSFRWIPEFYRYRGRVYKEWGVRWFGWELSLAR